jgi:WD40 repeat protein
MAGDSARLSLGYVVESSLLVPAAGRDRTVPTPNAMSFFTSTSSANALGTTSSGDRDIEVSDPPSDSISSLAFCPTAEYLAVGSWDNQAGRVKLYSLR